MVSPAVATPAGIEPAWIGGLWSLLWLLMISAPLVESDAYRYATFGLLGLYFWFERPDLRFVKQDYFALICLAWGSYALVRFLWGYGALGEKGTSEWLYAFPIFFPGLGGALYFSRRHILPTVTAFVLVAFVLLLVSTDFVTALSGERIYPLYHHNPIHAAIGCGFVMVISGAWLYHLFETRRLTGWLRFAAPALTLANMLLALFDIYGAKSKGVWLALIFAVVAVAALSALQRHSRNTLVMMLAGLVVLGAGAYVVRQNIVQTAGPTVVAAFSLSREAAADDAITGAMRHAIETPETPESMRERLQLWYNALEIIRDYPLFGAGNHWLEIWKTTTYRDVPYDLLHNGYLEIAVRHGVFGLVMLLISLVIACRRVIRARRLGLISRATESGLMIATLYFLVTLATNSNNRLAIGESFFMVTAAAVFAITIALRKAPDGSDGSAAPAAAADH